MSHNQSNETSKSPTAARQPSFEEKRDSPTQSRSTSISDEEQQRPLVEQQRHPYQRPGYNHPPQSDNAREHSFYQTRNRRRRPLYFYPPYPSAYAGHYHNHSYVQRSTAGYSPTERGILAPASMVPSAGCTCKKSRYVYCWNIGVFFY